MRKLTKGLVAGLMVVGLLAVAAPSPSEAQLQCRAPAGPGLAPCFSGTFDPLTLAASGVLIPFVLSSTGDVSILEIATPVGQNGLNRTGINPDANTPTGNSVHIVFFDASCVRTQSMGIDMTQNDIALIDFRGFLAQTASVAPGLAAVAQLGGSGFELLPLANPIHTRMYWFNVTAGALRHARIIEPIILDAWDNTEPNLNLANWSPLRTAATFFAPLDVNPLRTTLHLVCPISSIQGSSSTSDVSGIFPAVAFPLFQAPGNTTRTGFPGAYGPAAIAVNTSSGAGATANLRARVYDTNEHFVNDVQVPCSCWTVLSLVSISSLYANGAPAPNGVGPDGSYTEMEINGGTDTADSAFTGYRLLTIGAPGTPEFWNRLSNGARSSIVQQTGGIGFHGNTR